MQDHGETSRRAKIVQKFRNRVNACNKKMIAGSGTRHVQQMSLGVVDLFEVRVVSYGFDPGLQEQDLVVVRGDNDDATGSFRNQRRDTTQPCKNDLPITNAS